MRIIDNSQLFLIRIKSKKLMILKYMQSMMMFSTANHKIFSGKYYIQAPPKRPLSSYLIYTADARKSLPAPAEGQKVSVTAQVKAFGAQWKELKPEQKEKYEKKALELRTQYQEEKAKYQAKFVEPFKKVNYNSILMKQFYSKNKFTNLAEGSKVFHQFRQTLKEEDLNVYKHKAEQINKANQAFTDKYKIPVLQYKDFNAYLRSLRKADPDIPLKSKIDPVKLAKYQKEYENIKAQHLTNLKNFAKTFQVNLQDLIKQMNKLKDPSEKLDEEGRNLQELQKQQKQKALQELKKTKAKAAAQTEKIKRKYQKVMNKQIKDVKKTVEKSKKGVVRAGNKFVARINRTKIKKQEARIQQQAVKNLAKNKKLQQKEKEAKPVISQTLIPTAEPSIPKRKLRQKKTQVPAATLQQATQAPPQPPQATQVPPQPPQATQAPPQPPQAPTQPQTTQQSATSAAQN